MYLYYVAIMKCLNHDRLCLDSSRDAWAFDFLPVSGKGLTPGKGDAFPSQVCTCYIYMSTTMLLPLHLSLGLGVLIKSATVSRRAASTQITCYPAAFTNATLYYGNSDSPDYMDEIGVVNAYGNAALLAKYPSSNVNSLKVNVVPCDSLYLNYTVPTGCTTEPAPVLLYATDESGDCLQLQSSSQASNNVFIVKQSCSMVDDASQLNQIWTQTIDGEIYLPAGSKRLAAEAASWNLQSNDKHEVLANPPPICRAGQICQNGTQVAFYIQ